MRIPFQSTKQHETLSQQNVCILTLGVLTSRASSLVMKEQCKRSKIRGQIYTTLRTSTTTRGRKIVPGGLLASHSTPQVPGILRWLGTVVTSHTASNRQAYTPVMSMLQKDVQSTHCTSCNRPAHTNAIMLYAVKCSLYVVGPFLCRILHKRWSTGVKM